MTSRPRDDERRRAEAAEPGTAQRTARRLWQTATRQRFFAILVLLIVLFVSFALTQDRFFTSANIEALLTSAAILWVVAIGLTFVLLAGGFDLDRLDARASSIALGTFVNDFGIPIGAAIISRLPSARCSGAGSTACSSDGSASRSWSSPSPR